MIELLIKELKKEEVLAQIEKIVEKSVSLDYEIGGEVYFDNGIIFHEIPNYFVEVLKKIEEIKKAEKREEKEMLLLDLISITKKDIDLRDIPFVEYVARSAYAKNEEKEKPKMKKIADFHVHRNFTPPSEEDISNSRTGTCKREIVISHDKEKNFKVYLLDRGYVQILYKKNL